MKKGMFLLLFVILGCQPLVPIRKGNFITAVGTASIQAQQGKAKEEKIFKAMRASKLDAYKELSEQIYGVQVKGEAQVNDQILTSDNTQGLVSGIIRAAKVVSTYQVGETYVTELELNLDMMQKMAEYGESYHVPNNTDIIF